MSCEPVLHLWEGGGMSPGRAVLCRSALSDRAWHAAEPSSSLANIPATGPPEEGRSATGRLTAIGQRGAWEEGMFGTEQPDRLLYG